MATKPAFDPFSSEVIEAGPPAYSALMAECPFYHYQGRFDFYINSDYSEIREIILKDYTTWSFKFGPGPRDSGAMSGTGISTDPPIHDQFRHVIQRGFSPAKLARLSRDIDRIADELIDKMLDDPTGEGDFYELFAMPLPSRLMCIMLGTPEENYLKYKEWSDEQIVLLMNSPDVGAEDRISAEFGPHFFGLVNERRAKLREAGIDTPTLEHVGTVLPDDLMSRYICDRVDGRQLTDIEVLGLGVTILNAGNETTINLMGNLLWRLLELPSRWEMLKANPSLIEVAVEESLRYDPPVLGMLRKAIKPTQMKGCPVQLGERVMYNIAGANRDPTIWTDPDTFRLDRSMPELRKHIAFGGGNHLCLGLQLARMEAKQVFDKLVARLPNLRLTGAPERIRVFNFWGRLKLPVAWS